jgi:uncharacterized membrane protein YgaE (UPF0421/DUF939 family)
MMFATENIHTLFNDAGNIAIFVGGFSAFFGGIIAFISKRVKKPLEELRAAYDAGQAEVLAIVKAEQKANEEHRQMLASHLSWHEGIDLAMRYGEAALAHMATPPPSSPSSSASNPPISTSTVGATNG